MQQFIYEIPEVPESLNKFLGRQNHWQYRKEKARWIGVVRTFCRKRPSNPIQNAVVRLTYYFPTAHRRDPDNYSGKMILDGLVCHKILADDSFSNIRLVLEGKVDKKNPRTKIVITEVDSGV